MQSLDKLDLRRKKLIIFDMDGTLIDSVGIWNVTDQELITSAGGKEISLEFAQEQRDRFLHENQSSNSYYAYCAYLIKEYNLNIKDAQELLDRRWAISRKILKDELDFKPDAPELIFSLKQKRLKLALATMTTQTQLGIYTKENQKMMRQMNILKTFDLITSLEDVKLKKPDPEIYVMIMQHFNVRPDQCLVFEDSLTGVLASKSAGIETVNIYDSYADINRAEINKLADYRIDNYRQFINYLNISYGDTDEVRSRLVDTEMDR